MATVISYNVLKVLAQEMTEMSLQRIPVCVHVLLTRSVRKSKVMKQAGVHMKAP